MGETPGVQGKPQKHTWSLNTKDNKYTVNTKKNDVKNRENNNFF